MFCLSMINNHRNDVMKLASANKVLIWVTELNISILTASDRTWASDMYDMYVNCTELSLWSNVLSKCLFETKTCPSVLCMFWYLCMCMFACTIHLHDTHLALGAYCTVYVRGTYR